MNAVVLASLLSLTAAADPGVALLIGIDEYGGPALDLNSPEHDVELLSGALEEHTGLRVVSRENLDRKAFIDTLLEVQPLVEDKVLVFYFSGHAVQVDGENWLLPRSAHVRSLNDVPVQGISVRQVLQVFSGARTRILVLDACRTSPFGLGGKSAGSSGLSRDNLDNFRGTLISYAAAPGTVAYDGAPGEASPFTRALVKHLGTPGLDIMNLFVRVRGDLVVATADLPRGAQRSEEINSLTADDDLVLVEKVERVGGTKDAKPLPRIVITEMAAEHGIDPGVVRLLNELMLTQFQKSGRYTVIGSSDISAMLQAEQRNQLLACTETSCLAEMGGALGADLIAHASIGAVGDFYLINIKIIDVRRAVVVERVSREVDALENQLIAAMRSSVVEVTTGEAPKPPAPKPAPAALPDEPSEPATGPSSDALSGLAWTAAGIAGGATLIAAAVGVGFGTLAMMQAGASPFAANYSEHISGAQSSALVSSIGWGVAGVAGTATAAGLAALAFTLPAEEEP